MKTKPILTLAFVAALFSPVVSNAASTWNVSTSTTTTTTSGITMNSAAFSTAPNYSTTTAETFSAASLVSYSGGYGVSVGSSDPSNVDGAHAVDNVRGTDLVRLTFGQSVELSNVTLGWNGTDNCKTTQTKCNSTLYGDSDISILAYTGLNMPPSSMPPASTSIEGKTIAGLISSGWELVGHYANVGSAEPDVAIVNAAKISSSWWLVSAYNSGYGAALANETLNDSFKLISVAGVVAPQTNHTNKTPEPAGIALMGLGLLGLMASRRRITK